jgi:soluble lytic murein transglycosylase-like protein
VHHGHAQSGTRYATLNPGQDLDGDYGLIPQKLGRTDAGLYRKIFDVQREGRWNEADRLIASLQSDILMGHVLAQRYLHPTAYRSRYVELKRWLDLYADHPQANRIFRLAKQRRPADAPEPRRPIAGYLGGSGQELAPDETAKPPLRVKRTEADSRAVRKWLASIKALVGRDRPTQAREHLRNSRIRRVVDQYEYDLALWTISKGYFANNKDELAYKFSSTAAARSGVHAPMINWTAGLAAFRARLYDKAANHFVRIVGSRLTEGEQRAGAAFWAARSYLLAGKPRDVGRYLRIAANSSDEFYGVLAQALLGQPIVFDWHEGGLNGSTIALLNRFPGSQRAIALGEVGQLDLAEREIRKLAARAQPALAQALVALADHLDLPAAQMRIAQRLRLQDGRRHDGAMFPIPEWSTSADHAVEPSLLLAITRAESAFDHTAVSAADARGLMQILPGTARELSRRYGLRYRNKQQLHDPETNIRFGAAYVNWLRETDLVGDNLIYLLMAYNGGPNRVQGWLKQLKHIDDDPILFLESVPVPETREYVKKVMANLWAYRAQLEEDTPSLIALAENSWPGYRSLEDRSSSQVASND